MNNQKKLQSSINKPAMKEFEFCDDRIAKIA